ncbi:acyltransferase [Erwiniaceae bacterium BAC15a-03b]|uniref:Acyltransferase n=2 Tax=Winslowiella arboricola TaxID=2978220 RepID=A0A9J6PCN5_9GAMM|nr:acyltransferase family protein [Winslowiella arboricola]MCU5771591.1 acyltransferase [Winslowiella arboricola]MCU5775937.1 acyltransferase [Winslowiella arboricola]
MFRLDINALRFLAVAGVVFFHFKFDFLPGGYAGVDVFFVISGYLMHEILSKKEITISSTIDFYQRRVKRIYPALLVMVIAYALVMVAISPPSVVREAFKEVAAALVFASNLYFWKETSGYFSSNSDAYFLLHTWSLGVEFQFYLMFPIVLWFIQKLKFSKQFILLAVSLISLALCLMIAEGHPKPNFYLLPFRAWELFIGAFASSLKFSNPYKKPTELISVAAIVAFFVFAQETPVWPNYTTLIPTFFTALILHANVNNERVLLKNTLFQKIGLWSYSIYLFHWPIVSIFYVQNIEYTLVNQIIGIILSVLLGFLSYTLVERRFTFSWIKVPVSASLFVALFFGLSSYSISSKWLSNDVIALDKMSQYISRIQFGSDPAQLCFLTSSSSVEDFNFEKCTQSESGKKNLLILGDSHAAQFSQALREQFHNYNIIQVTASQCPAIVNSKGDVFCTKLMHYALNDLVNSKKIDAAIVLSDWNNFYATNNLARDIPETYNLLAKKIEKVYFISQTKHFQPSVYRLLQIYGINADINDHREKGTDAVYQEINKIASQHNVKMIDIYDYGCTGGKCAFINSNHTPMFFDDNHFTYEWTKEIAAKVFANYL